MDPELESIFPEIGNLALTSARGHPARLLLYAEVEDGVISADLFSENRTSSALLFQVAPPPLEELVYRFWERWRAHPGNREWRALTYKTDGISFAFDLAYPDQIDEDAGIIGRRQAAVADYFGDRAIDYSDP